MVGVSKRKPGQLVSCTQCHTEKPWSTGPDAFKSESGKPRQPCSRCDTENRERRRKENIGVERVKGRERMQKWRKNNPEKERAAWLKPRKFDKERARERVNKWRRGHPESGRKEYRKRKARKDSLPHAFTKQDWSYCLAYWDQRCCICGRVANNGYTIAQEHWIALADTRQDNPGTVPWNILPMCHARPGAKGGCNNSKQTKDPIEWLNTVLHADEAQEKRSEIMDYFNTVRPDFPNMHIGDSHG